MWKEVGWPHCILGLVVRELAETRGELVRGGRALHSEVCLWTGLMVLRAEEGAEGNGVGKKPKDKNRCFKAYIALGDG